MKATGWQVAFGSVALWSGVLGKKMGLTVTSHQGRGRVGAPLLGQTLKTQPIGSFWAAGVPPRRLFFCPFPRTRAFHAPDPVCQHVAPTWVGRDAHSGAGPRLHREPRWPHATPLRAPRRRDLLKRPARHHRAPPGWPLEPLPPDHRQRPNILRIDIHAVADSPGALGCKSGCCRFPGTGS